MIKGFPEQRANITIEMDSNGGVLLREIYTCTNPQCPDKEHMAIVKTPVDALKIIQKWTEQLMIVAAVEGQG